MKEITEVKTNLSVEGTFQVLASQTWAALDKLAF